MSSQDTQNWAPAPDVPEDAIVEYEVRFVSYLDLNGDAAWNWSHTPGVSTTDVIGLLARFQHYLAHRVEDDHGFSDLFDGVDE
jgi:hypothetical protein